MRLPRSHKIRVRLLALLGATVAGLALVVAGVWTYSIEPALRDNVAKAQREVAQRAADLIDDFIEEKITELRAAAQIGHLWTGAHDHRRESLYQLMKVVRAVREISIIDAEGRETMRMSRTRTYMGADLRSFARADEFLQPMSGKVFVGSVRHEQTAEPFVTLAVPIESSAVEIKGVLLAEINLKTLWDVVAPIKVGNKGFIYVVSATGQLIAHYDYSRVVAGTNLAHVTEVAEFLQSPQNDGGFGSIEAGYSAPRVMTTYALVPLPKWGVFVEESVETAFAEAHRLKMLALAILGFAIVVVLVIAFRFSRRLSAPIRELEAGAERIAQGELDHRLDIRTGDEIESLAGKFNRMAAALKESHRDLEGKIADRTREISSLYAAIAPLTPADSLARTLDNVLIRLCEATGADAARVRLWDPKQRIYVTPATLGFDPSATGLIEPPGQLPAADHVFNTGTPAIIADLSDDARIKRGKLVAAGFRSAAFLPLNVGNETIGVVQLASRTEGYFKPDKEALFMAIARQMGIAMENRDLFEQIQRNLERIRALHDIDNAIAESLDLTITLDVLLEKIALFLPLPAAYTIKLFNPESGALEAAACKNVDDAGWRESVRRRPAQAIPEAFQRNAPLVIKNIQADPGVPADSFFVENSLVSYLGVPLAVKDGLLGVLGLYTFEAHDFTSEEIDFLVTLGGQAAIAINNSRLYEKTQRQAAALEASNRLKDEFLGMMSHELRTPLSVIAGYANLLADETFGKITPEQKKGVRVIRERAQGLSELVGTILNAAQLASGTAALTLERVSLAELLSSIKQCYPQSTKDAVALDWEFSANLPELVTDRDKLAQILKNLIDNALKFTDNGSITVSARPAQERGSYLVSRISSGQLADDPPGTNHEIRDTRFEPRDTRFVEFSVADTGIGITSDAVPFIFEKFRQADSTQTRDYEGAGLGLFIVKKFTELLGGEVRVASEPGRGSTFTVVLPCRVAAGAAGQIPAEVAGIIAASSQSCASPALKLPPVAIT